jgi:hypothetical protein
VDSQVTATPRSDFTLPRDCTPVRASVWAGGVETDYLRAGCGEPLLLLLPPGRDIGSDRLLGSLAMQYRVTAASAPVDVDVASWIRDFLEGVGVVPVRIVAVGQVAELAAEEWRRWYGSPEPDSRGVDTGAGAQSPS